MKEKMKAVLCQKIYFIFRMAKRWDRCERSQRLKD